MPQTTDDPLDRALVALEQLAEADMPAGMAATWQTVRKAILEARGRHNDLMAVAREGRALLAVLGGSEAAVAEGEPDRIAQLAEAREAADGALAEALSHVSFDSAATLALGSEAAFLKLMDDLGGNQDDEDEQSGI